MPSNRPQRLSHFRKAWRPLFEKHDVDLFVVYDIPPWENIPGWVPRQSDMIRSWGIVQAYKSGSEFILSLDDDVTPLKDSDIFEEYEAAFERKYPCSRYFSTGSLTMTGHEMRGFPYWPRDKEVAVQYGGWIGVPDFDAATQLEHPESISMFVDVVVPVPKDSPTTCCAMNFAFRREYTPLMWQLPIHAGVFNRFGDIWSGLFQKKVLDHVGAVMLINGRASVRHDRASDPAKNLEKEAPGLSLNEDLWWNLRKPRSSKLIEAFVEVTDSAAAFFGSRTSVEYANNFIQARNEWVKCFE